MENLLSSDADALRELRASCCDPKHPVQQICGDDGFWLTTGSFPQEVVIEFKRAAHVKEIRVVSRGVKQLQLYNEENSLVGEESWPDDTGDNLQKQEHTCSLKKGARISRSIRMCIYGFDDFVSVASVKVLGECPKEEITADRLRTSPIISPQKSGQANTRAVPSLKLKQATDQDYKEDDSPEPTPMEQKKSALAGNWDDKPLFGRKGKAGGVKTKFKVYTPRSKAQVQSFTQGQHK
jgi:hypothetical protein